MDRTQLLEKSHYEPPAPTPNSYIPPLQSRANVKNPEFCVPIQIDESRFYNDSHTRNLPFNELRQPLYYFSLYFSKSILSQIVDSTNAYAQRRREDTTIPNSRLWKTLTRDELLLWLGIMLYISFLSLPSPSMCWDSKTRVRHVADYMPETRFQQILRYIHTSLLPPDQPNTEWYDKVEPVAGLLRANFRRYISPASCVAVDEMMVKCTGRTKHTVKIERKPIKQGYKVLALCVQGYLWDFFFWSRI